tara:strand:- start:4455 stop:4670 length:216 start_codon:yes stop_codon:yes gene_type:complete
MSSTTQPINIPISSEISKSAYNNNYIIIPTCKVVGLPEHPNNTPDDNIWSIKLIQRIKNYQSSKLNNFDKI